MVPWALLKSHRLNERLGESSWVAVQRDIYNIILSFTSLPRRSKTSSMVDFTIPYFTIPNNLSLQTIENKFSEFQLNVEAGAERFAAVDDRATNLMEQKNPNSEAILERQEHLR